jgi:hypothetical protein
VTSAFLLAFASRSESGAATFFPLVAGTKWVYSDTAINQDGYVDSVGNTQDIAGRPATPIVTTRNGKVDGSTFYRVEDDQVLVVAFEQNRPLGSPYPILKVGPGNVKWTFVGSIQMMGAPAPIAMKGSSKRAGHKELFGSKRDLLEVTIDITIEASPGMTVKTHQVSTYAEGIGLVELKEKTKVNKNTSERTRKLVSFTEN